VAQTGSQLETGIIFDIKRYALHDGPGIRTTVFFKGCPLSCWWCHNPESQDFHPEVILRTQRCAHCAACAAACPQGAITLPAEGEGGPLTDRDACTACWQCVQACFSGARQLVGQEVSVQALMTEILRDRSFFDESGGGVTFSGGEPLSQPRFLAAVLRACRQEEIHTAVDTSGYAPWTVFDALRRDVDLFLYDLKIFDAQRHRRYTGVANELILENLTRLARLGHAIYVRVPVIPGINDDEDNLRQIAAFVAGQPGIQRLDILPYHPSAAAKYAGLERPYPLADTNMPAGERMEEIALFMRQYGLYVKTGG